MLFRGKCVKTNEWLYGDLLRDGDYYAISNDVRVEENVWKKRVSDVFPESVGQYVGMKDDYENVKIFDGDIVRLDKFSFLNKEYEGSLIGRVVCNSDYMGFSLVDISHPDFKRDLGYSDDERASISFEHLQDWGGYSRLRVLGNSFDNNLEDFS